MKIHAKYDEATSNYGRVTVDGNLLLSDARSIAHVAYVILRHVVGPQLAVKYEHQFRREVLLTPENGRDLNITLDVQAWVKQKETEGVR